ncbi:uncharacterized protein GGS22DRAFT_167959 [Annulohypoxylon maeteangense]|uniref:uncharacterized protein n=1 Tax=Annulohypoxylon maeteangense TaxID=1927788 RepID=UPI0020073D23|nr:uncharacterized protein GGS22DRAFT_167959 [Annulohypoxylon maeteangense]KAI0883133.1 hypothetical protein GGS22DRAFT_167959 [Annulohypoxylon maeteangense]
MTIRPRSCLSCAKGKAGCDNRRPKCSRCISKAIECHYPASTPRATGPGAARSDDASVESGNPSPSSGLDSLDVDTNPQIANNISAMIIDDAVVLPEDTDFANLGGDYVAWDDASTSLADFLNGEANDPYLLQGSSSLARPSTPSSDPTIQIQQSLSTPSFTIPRSPIFSVRSLVHRPKMQAGPQRIANLILHTLKSYPLMMLRHDTLPPFIHPSLVSPGVDNVHMEPLTNCMCLTHMISSGVQGSRKLFWKNVRMECERFYAEYLSLSKWELLAAMQALSIYILIRLDEGETDHNNVDFILVKAVAVIAQQLTHSDVTCHAQCGLCNNELEGSWKEWIFRESRRRLGVIYRVVNMLIYFEPAAMCDIPKDLILAPLPAKRQLWEAGDEFVWKAESQREPGIQVSFGLATDGEIVKIDSGRLSCSDAWLEDQSTDANRRLSSAASWEEWCSGIDGFGGLVMLAASLIV